MSEPIDRRHLLKVAAIGIAAAGAVAPGASAADPPPAAPPKQRRPLKKAYFGLPKASNLVEQMKTLKECGFDGLQLNMPAKALPVDKVQEALQETGLKPEGTCDADH